MNSILVEIKHVGDGIVASVKRRPELHGYGSTISNALRELAKSVEYVASLELAADDIPESSDTLS